MVLQQEEEQQGALREHLELREQRAVELGARVWLWLVVAVHQVEQVEQLEQEEQAALGQLLEAPAAQGALALETPSSTLGAGAAAEERAPAEERALAPSQSPRPPTLRPAPGPASAAQAASRGAGDNLTLPLYRWPSSTC